MGAMFWLRWSWRDLRKRSHQAVAIAVILALGSGIYAGLGMTSVWRRASLEASLESLSAHDVRVEVLGGITLGADVIESAIRSADVESIIDMESRLTVRTPVTVVRDDEVISAAGLVIGVDTDSGPRIDRWQIVGDDIAGRAPDEGTVLLDLHFAQAHDLPESGTLRVGADELRYSGLALAPEFFNLTTTAGASIQGAATRAVLYAPIGIAREIAGQADVVNNTVIRLGPDGDAAAAAETLQSALSDTAPVNVTTLADDVAIKALRDEIDSEQRLFNVFALLVLAGAGFAAFSLVKRVVESQRRDIGNAMSLGVPRYLIALRTMLLPAQIVLLGVLLGLAAAQGLAVWVLSVIKSGIPLPVWVTPAQPALLARAAALTVLMPIIATAVPVWRAVRMRPVDALAPQHLRSGRHRLSDLFGRLPLPGTTLMQAPLRRILRSPARSVVTVLAISFIIGPLLAALGATDSTAASLAEGDRASGIDSLVVELQTFESEEGPTVGAIIDQPGVTASAVGLDIGGFAQRNDVDLGISIAMADLRDPVAVPSDIADQQLEPGGIVLSRKAALGVLGVMSWGG